MSDAIRLLEWDSEFFGFPIAQVEAQRVDQATLDAVEQACRAQEIRCAYLLLESDDLRGAALAQAAGFVLRDVRITLERMLSRDDPVYDGAEHGIAPARPDQRAALEALARESFSQGRFATDPNFPPGAAGELYAAFVRRGFESAPRRVVLTDPAAQSFLVYDGGGEDPNLEVMAVHADARGRGLANALFSTATSAVAQAGHERVWTVTQGANVVTQRVHQRYGFRTRAVDLWLHRWF